MATAIVDTTLGLSVREGISRAVPLAKEVVLWAKGRGLQVATDEKTAILLGEQVQVVPREELAQVANPIVTLGGDGTLIGVARYAQSNPPVMIGVNFGNLGFLTEILPSELMSVLASVFEGKATTGTRNLLQAEVVRRGKTIFSVQAVNDAVVLKGAQDPLLEIDLSVNGEEVMRLRADGLIASTPTGSTAYSLAAGGSIAFPELAVTLLTPICAHSLTSRPLILPSDHKIELYLPEYHGTVHLSVDGQVSQELTTGDLIKITRSQATVRFVRSPSHSYFSILRRKLNWGLPNDLS